MKNKFAIILSAGIALLLSACATIPVQPGKERFWPLPPDPPVISYLTSFTEPKDMGPQRNWFRRAIKFLFGEGGTPYMLRPYAVATNGNGKVYVTDTGLQAVHIYDFPSKTYQQIFWIERGRSRLMSPVGIALDENEMIYVSDSELNRIFVYEPRKRKLVRTLGKPGQFQRLSGIAYDPKSHHIYAVDTTAHQITVLETDGTVVKTFGRRGTEEGEFNFPTHIAVDSNGLVYVTDSMNFRVQIFDSDGRPQGTLGRLGTTLGTFSKPKGVAVDTEGHVYVVDGIYDTVQIFDRKGELLMNFGQTGEKEGDFWLPAGIAIDRKNRIYIADTYNKRVQVFQFMGTPKEEPAAAPVSAEKAFQPIENK